MKGDFEKHQSRRGTPQLDELSVSALMYNLVHNQGITERRAATDFISDWLVRVRNQVRNSPGKFHIFLDQLQDVYDPILSFVYMANGSLGVERVLEKARELARSQDSLAVQKKLKQFEESAARYTNRLDRGILDSLFIEKPSHIEEAVKRKHISPMNVAEFVKHWLGSQEENLELISSEEEIATLMDIVRRYNGAFAVRQIDRIVVAALDDESRREDIEQDDRAYFAGLLEYIRKRYRYEREDVHPLVPAQIKEIDDLDFRALIEDKKDAQKDVRIEVPPARTAEAEITTYDIPPQEAFRQELSKLEDWHDVLDFSFQAFRQYAEEGLSVHEPLAELKSWSHRFFLCREREGGEFMAEFDTRFEEFLEELPTLKVKPDYIPSTIRSYREYWHGDLTSEIAEPHVTEPS